MSGSKHNPCANQIVVLVPGMYSPRAFMLPMARRFKQLGFQTLIFQNRYLLKTPEQNAQRLLTRLQTLKFEQVHLLGHSLGGIVIMNALKLNSELPGEQQFAMGKVVMVASPVKGSEFARYLHSKRLGRPLMGRCAVESVLNGLPEVLDGREIGVISGSSRAGLAAMVYQSKHSNDGMINEFETHLDGAKDTVSVPQSHAIMLFSRHCSDLAAQFLRHGRFRITKRVRQT